ncbi:MAG TPA: GNAT family N-acetyltransferase, partial [Tepidisphaeraceae bacterium]
MRVTARLGECLFRPLTDSDRDTDFVLALRNHPRFRPWFYSAVPSREAHLKFLEKVRAGDDILWLIEEAGEPVAISSIYHFDWTNRKCECGRIASLSPKCFAVNFVICATIIFES